MDSVKAAVGLGSKKDDSGEEPVSGAKGEGTTAKPFDAGNSDEAQASAKAQPEQQDSSSTAQKDSKDKSSGGGGFLKSINPFGSKKQEGEGTSATAGAEKHSSAPSAEIEDSKRPPNHLGVIVPEGHSQDFAAPQLPDQSPAEAKKMADNQPNQTVANASAEGTDSGFGKRGQLNPDWQSRSASGATKQQQLRGSRASMSAPSGQRVFNPGGTNPGRIPTAGGQTVGARPAEDRRRKSMWGSQGDASMQPLDMQGSPDPVTQDNTAANTAPLTTNGEGSSKQAEEPKPNFNTFAWGEGGEGTTATTAGAEKKEEGTTTSTDAANGNKSTAAEKAEEAKDKVKDVLPTSSTGGANSEPKKERRASRFDAFKSKLGMGKS